MGNYLKIGTTSSYHRLNHQLTIKEAFKMALFEPFSVMNETEQVSADEAMLEEHQTWVNFLFLNLKNDGSICDYEI